MLLYNVLEGGTSPDLKIIRKYAIFPKELDILRRCLNVVVTLSSEPNKLIISGIIACRLHNV